MPEISPSPKLFEIKTIQFHQREGLTKESILKIFFRKFEGKVFVKTTLE